ncbi:MAG: class I SAM-dependent methyltransferase, partial [Planctomycetota bacterium]
MNDAGSGTRPDDPYARAQYRRLIAWERRIGREGPWLEELLAGAPERSVLDLGCGTGEHTAFFAARGARAVGVDASPSMIEAARTYEGEGGPRFVLGDIREVERLLAGGAPFGLALVLGHVLPHLTEDADLDRFLDAVRACLLPGGLLLHQLLNYARIRARGERHLPLNVREGEAGRWIVFLRLLECLDRDHILFLPTTLE